MTSDSGQPDAGDRHLAWITIEETPDAVTVARIEGCLLDHQITVRVLGPGDPGCAGVDNFEVQIPEADFDRALEALEELDDDLES